MGETLTADTTGIADPDGLDNAQFAYQWLADDAAISGATGSTYALADADEGKAIKVKVSFTDDGGNDESRTSAATAAVAAAPASNSPATGAPTISGTAQVGETLTADTTGIADADGLDNAQFAYQWLADDAAISGATGSTYALADPDEGKAIKVKVSFTDDGGNDESRTSAATAAVAAAPASNSPATGAPTISGTAQVGETLTADTTGIADADGLDNAQFAYQWLADDAAISGATGSTYTLADPDEGKAIKVRVSFTDDGGNDESRTSAATAAVAPADDPTALTADFKEVPDSHDGSNTFTFELRFSEEFPVSYLTLKDGAFTEVGGEVTNVRRLERDSDTPNLRWEITVSPSGDGDVTITLPETTDCDAEGAICTEDDRMLSEGDTASVGGGNDESRISAAAQQGTCSGGGCDPVPVEVEVTAVPIVVASTTDDYFVLYVRHDVDGATVELPVLVRRGEAGTTTLAENVAAVPAERYRVEKYLIATPGDVDGDGVDDITELDSLGSMNPVNPATNIERRHGAVAIPDEAAFADLGSSRRLGKFVILDMDTDSPGVYFINLDTYRYHTTFIHATFGRVFNLDATTAEAGRLAGELYWEPRLDAPDGSRGAYLLELNEDHLFGNFDDPAGVLDVAYSLLAASVPALDQNLVIYVANHDLVTFQDVLPGNEESRISFVLQMDSASEITYSPLNPGVGFGLLRVIGSDERPGARDVVVYGALPNTLPRVAGIISAVPQTPLSHVNLRAIQDGVPNAYVKDAVDNSEIGALLDRYVRYEVTEDGWDLRAATLEEVDAHYEWSRPAEAQTPERDLSVREITALSEIDFDDWTAFGVKAANVAVLGTLGFPEGTAPDGFAVPFYFYDEFMKANGLYDDIKEVLADPDFQTDFGTQESELKKLRKAIKKADTPQWIVDALTAMHATYPEGQSLRYRSSTNNEDLPGFNGAGLYDSKTQKPDETEKDGIDKSLKQVYASLWNFRAFSEREFHRIDHLAAAMGVLVHPNYKDERVNGVAVSFDPLQGRENSYYVNSQLGEDLVTNPEAHSTPEQIVLPPWGPAWVLATSNQTPPGRLLLTAEQMALLRRHLNTIHTEFAKLYAPGAGEPFAMEIEFKITSAGILAIKQARPWVFSAPNQPQSNRPPAFPATERGVRSVAENTAAGLAIGAPVAAVDPNTDDTLDYSLSGDDAASFDIVASTGQLQARAALDYETKESYTVTVSVHDGKDANGDADTAIDDSIAVTILVNRPATGAPTISGTAQVGQTLTADTTGIADADGLVNASYSYQWVANDETSDADITGATASTYTLADADEGKGITVRVSFADDAGNAETLTSTATATVQARPNTPATGTPTVSGTAQVGQTLTADISAVADTDGLDDATFSYQWVSSNGTTDTDITGATGSSYTLVSDDEGKTIKVRVSFTDDMGNEESLTSGATEAVAAKANSPATGAPTISGTAQVGETLAADTSGIADTDGLDDATFSYQWVSSNGTTDTDITGVTDSTYTLVSDDEANTVKVRVSFTDDAGNQESLTSAATAAVAAKANSPATGAPTISGTAQVGETLAADTSGIADTDGLDSATFSYQWVSNNGTTDTDITGVTDSTYTLVSADEGKTIKVRVSFTDDMGNEESLTSAATAAVAAKANSPATGAPTISGTAQVGETLAADTSGIADTDGLENAALSYQWVSNNGTTDTDITGATDSSYTLVSDDEAKTVKVRVSFTDDAGNEESLTSAATAAVAAKANSPATGAPTITAGTAQVGETLTADTSGIADTDGLSNAALSYQWVSSNGTTDTDITGATDSTYTLVSDDEGKTVKVRVSFTDDMGNEESLTSAATDAIAPVPTGEEETEEDGPIWSATMTAGLLDDGYGYSSFAGGAGELSETEFELDGVTYTIKAVVAWGWMYIAVDKELPMDFRLEVDGKQFDSRDASLTSYSYASVYKWEEAQLEWAEGDTIELALYRAD